MKKIISIVLLFAFGFSSCEKDDICDANTPTTPRLVITFYDDIDPTTPAPVLNLKVEGEGEDTPIIFNPGAAGEAQYLANTSSIKLPLKTNEDTVTYKFTYNANSPTPGAIVVDYLTFRYTRENIYVSRACGFKMNFVLDPLEPYVHTSDGTPWMLNITVKNRNIVSENETHLDILF
ncbi:DUF6452 family protein [Flavobacterium hungaricum]|uniref:DUF1735 domain-containing protein n=1 Tax=Flavobacterium hungaricum TaxID=2082725 RepID=A0ABR9TEY1_9FLAO|nr:DUF6452 family protein [Flavobacterium hungaricum]MBE8723917.1 hypothetical protein [Flavobacterium hungaricum]